MLNPHNQEPRDGDFARYIDELMQQRQPTAARKPATAARPATPRATTPAQRTSATQGAPADASAPGQQAQPMTPERVKLLLRAIALGVIAAIAFVNALDFLREGIGPDSLAPALVLGVVALVSGARAWQSARQLRASTG